MTKPYSRRQFLTSLASFTSPVWLAYYSRMLAAERKQVRITDIKTMLLKGPRTYTLVKVETDGGWMDDVIVHEKPLCRDGFVTISDKPGLGIELNPDVVKAHLAPGETWWG